MVRGADNDDDWYYRVKFTLISVEVYDYVNNMSSRICHNIGSIVAWFSAKFPHMVEIQLVRSVSSGLLSAKKGD
jgi:hypothetical protein